MKRDISMTSILWLIEAVTAGFTVALMMLFKFDQPNFFQLSTFILVIVAMLCLSHLWMWREKYDPPRKKKEQ